MSDMTAADYAAILDPERKVTGWWTKKCPDCGTLNALHANQCRRPSRLNAPWIYTGPPDLHTAREHAWRGEEWLEARGYSILRQVHGDQFCYTIVRDQYLDVIMNKQDHAVAIAEAVRRVNDGQE